jgi:acetyl-CoA carboxylase carboxyl transferase subunit beta
LLQKWRNRRRAKEAFAKLPDGLWVQCRSCQQIIFRQDMERNLGVCPKCNHHHPLTPSERLATILDGAFTEINHDLTSTNPLDFPDYDTKLARDQSKTDNSEAIVTGTGEIGGYAIAIGVMDFRFMGGSMGSVVGEKFVRLVELAVVEQRTLIIVAASGGARMQEGILSLMQMPKTCAAVSRAIKEAGHPYFGICTHPTMAGVLASFAAEPDVIISEPGAMIGLAGQRVGEQAQATANVPANFQTAEFQLDRGMIDMIVPRRDIRPALIDLLRFSGGGQL